MSYICSLIHLALFLSLSYNTIGEYHLDTNQKPQTYIISIQNNLKPSTFSNVEEWYKSIVRKTNSNPDDSLLHVYKTVFHGFSARLRPDQADSVKAQPEVTHIFLDEIYQLHTTRTPHFLGLDTYHRPMGLLKDSDLGSNVVVGVIDTGIWPENPSFSDEELGPVPSHFRGECKGGENFPPHLCNKKIVGVRYFSSALTNNESKSARDDYGHGTHTASTIAGRTKPENVSFFGYANGQITGLAPKARLAIYKVCWKFGCIGADVLAALDKSVEDGVDIISISLGGPTRRYTMDPIAIGAFGALQRGVFVSASAGNSGHSEGSLSNSAPWITTIGASTIDRTFPADVILDNDIVLTGSSLYTGDPLPENKTFPLTHFSSNMSKQLCLQDSLDEKEVKGKIVICSPGMSDRVQKGVVVKKASGVGVIIAMNDPSISNNDTLKSDPFMIPGLTIPFAATTKLMDYIGKQQVKKATLVFRGTQIGRVSAPVVAAFSSRGPNTLSIYVLKPDMIAPGVDILAAWPNNISPTKLSEDPRRSDYNVLSGTSMSCPHVSGIAALLKGAHPDWTPATIRSALMTTAYNGYHETTPRQNPKQLTFWDTGAGHVDPTKANDPGLVYDLSEDDYIDFLCASKYNDKEIKMIVKRPVSCDKKNVQLWDLNYPAIIVTSDLEDKMIFRSLTSVDSVTSNYTAKIVSPKGTNVIVSPLELKFRSKGEKLSYSVKVSALDEGSLQSGGLGSLTWTDGKRNVTIPLMVA
ncbi:subtilisin-like protease SBT1.5 [Beta vulgaris subsp. vulgaris]|nr:subtilisin-like protease SBT1.5 [Beta vulgaris subsp. vulgaris]